MAQDTDLGRSARQSLLWGGGAQLIKEIAQFGAMLVLVRLLTPEDYGTVTLAQAFIGLGAIVSFGTFSTHALQVRNIDTIDWQGHFTAGAVVNACLAILALLVALIIAGIEKYAAVAAPLAALSILYLIEVPATLRQRMLEVHHEWLRLRTLVLTGGLIGLAVALVLAFLGAGYWALLAPPLLLGVPSAIDLFVYGRFRPNWSWNGASYSDAISFGAQRAISAATVRVRTFFEQGFLTALFSLAALGIFTRAISLASLLVGRLGSIAVMSLYPVLTRAEPSSPRFQRLAGLILRGVTWGLAPSIAFLCVVPTDIVLLLYGSRWAEVAPLLPWAALSVGLYGAAGVCTSLLLANESRRLVVWFDVLAASSAILLAWLLLPLGAVHYLSALSGLGAVVFASACLLLWRERALTMKGVTAAIIPPLVAASLAVLCVRNLLPHLAELAIWLRLLISGTALALVFAAILRLAFARALYDLLVVVPAGKPIARFLILKG